jgi:hypothetical protein
VDEGGIEERGQGGHREEDQGRGGAGPQGAQPLTGRPRLQGGTQGEGEQ